MADSSRVVARATGTSRSTVQRQRRADPPAVVTGRDTKTYPAVAVNVPARVERVHALRTTGSTIRAIAAALGVSTGTVVNDLRRLGQLHTVAE